MDAPHPQPGTGASAPPSDADIDARAIADVVDRGGPTMAYQPIRRCSDRIVVGYEALSRFAHGGPPDAWFRVAGELGLSVALEASAIARALAETERLPPAVFLSVNVSPASLLSSSIRDLLGDNAHRDLIVEITEGADVEVGGDVHLAVIGLRSAGCASRWTTSVPAMPVCVRSSPCSPI